MAEEKKRVINGTTVIGEGNSMTIIPKSSKSSSPSSTERTKKNDTGRSIVSGEGNNMTIIPSQSSTSRTMRLTGSIDTAGHGGTSTNYGTYQQDLDRLTQAQRQAQIDQLKAARTKALANLDAQEQTIKPYYQTARNQTAAASQQGARSFNEYLANRGLTNSGAAAQGEINRLSSLNNNLGNLNTAEANALRDIANQRTQVENDYVAGLANANNAISNNYYNNLLNYNEQQRQYVQGLQNQALGQYANDYQAQINNLLAQGYDPNSLEVLQLQALRGNKANTLYNNGQANALANIQAGNINYNNAAQLGMTIPQAQAYYQNYVAQQQAQAQAEAEALAYSRQQDAIKNELNYNNYLLNQQKVANDTAQTNYNINKPYYKPTTPKATNNVDSNMQGLIERWILEGKTDAEIEKLING